MEVCEIVRLFISELLATFVEHLQKIAGYFLLMYSSTFAPVTSPAVLTAYPSNHKCPPQSCFLNSGIKPGIDTFGRTETNTRT